MKLARVLPVLASLLLAAGCSTDGITFFSQNGLSVRATSDTLLLFNHSSDPIHYLVFDDSSPVGVSLLPADLWPSIGPGAEVTSPLDKVDSRTRPRSVSILWWTNGRYQPTIELSVP